MISSRAGLEVIMTNSRIIFRAFVSSVILMLLSISMLVGTTYAWMTEIVEISNNTVVAGNLDIELCYYNGGSFVPVDDNNIFDDRPWEPGLEKITYLRLSNVGNIDILYSFSLRTVVEIPGTNTFGEGFDLSDYITVSYVTYDPDNMEHSVYEALDSAEKYGIGEGYSTDGIIFSDDESVYIAIVASVPTSAADNINYISRADEPKLVLGVNLLAQSLEANE